MLVLGIIFYFFHNLATILASNDILLFVQTLSRHGARSPIATYPHDNYNESQWFQGFGQLTRKGMAGAQNLGDFLRKRYVITHGLLSSEYIHQEVYVRSTDVDRTLLTARLSLDHLFLSNHSLNPVPIHTISQKTDNMLYQEGCEVYNARISNAYMDDEIKKIDPKIDDFITFLSTKVGFKVESLAQLEDIADSLKCKSYNNFSLPDWAVNPNKSVYLRLQKFMDAVFEVSYNRYDNAKLRSGLLLGNLVHSLQLKATNNLTDKAHLYYAHDTTVAPLLAVLGVFNNRQPPFASTVLVELYKKNKNHSENKNDKNKKKINKRSNLRENKRNGVSDAEFKDFYVKVLFRNDTLAEPYELEIPGCQVNCPLHKFIELTRANVVDSDWDQLCLLKPKLLLRDILLIVASSLLIFCVIVIIILMVACCRTKGTYHRYVDVPTEIE